MSKENKPIHKKWWFWLGAIVIFGFIVGQTSDDSSEEEVAEAEEQETDEQPKEEVEGMEEEEHQEQTIDVNKEMEFDMGNLTLDIESIYIEDNTLSLGFWWNYWSSYEEAHFLLFAYPVVMQNGEELEEVDKKESLLKQTEKGVDSRVDLEYELEDDSPVEIKIKTTSDDPEEETITIELEG